MNVKRTGRCSGAEKPGGGRFEVDDTDDKLDAILSELQYLREVVNQNLRDSVQEPNLARTRSHTLVLTAESAFEGQNWYWPETGGKSTWRWSGPGRLSTIMLPIARDQILRCALHVMDFAQGVDDDLTVFVDGRPARVSRNGMRFEFDIEKSLIDRRATEIGFLTNATQKPSGDGDSRWLGFCFKTLEVYPAADADAADETNVKAIRPAGQTPSLTVASNEKPESSARASRNTQSGG